MPSSKTETMVERATDEEFSPEWEARLRTLIDQPSEMFNVYRIAILLGLYHVDSVDYTTLRDSLRISDGHLSTHLKTLKRKRFILGKRELQENRVRTMLSITDRGGEALERMFATLIQVKGRLGE
jgi:DNA-binding MarR family transcriptional regulator